MSNPLGDNEFDGQIVVASRIVDYLSSGLYQSPAACLKELINNAYDADANRVDVYVKPDANRIIIEDDGSGMNRADFEKNFKRISESYKREESDVTPSGRPKIGKIGIGFIAANEICDVMEIVSTKVGSDELLEVSINFDLMRQDHNERRKSDTEFAKADYRGHVSKTDMSSHFTKVFLKKVRGDAQSILSGVGTSAYASGKISLYGLTANSIFKKLHSPSLKSWSEFDAYSKNILEVGLNVPVSYYKNWLPATLRKEVGDIEVAANQLNFNLFFDGSEVLKPIVFNPEDKRTLISRFEYEGKHVSAIGYFYAQHTRINPQEIQGLLLRIRNSAVGNYDPNFLGYSPTLGPLFQSWISGEIMADDRLEDSMNIDRRTLRIAHPAYVELQQAVHDHLDKLIKRVKNEIYGVGSQERQIEKAEKIKKKILEVTSQEIAKIDKDIASEVKKAWNVSTTNVSNQKMILKKYSVDELYEIMVEVAQEFMTHAQLQKFIRRLTERLHQ